MEVNLRISKTKKHNLLKKLLLWLGCMLTVILIALVFLFRLELETLFSLKELDSHPLYQMDYAGDYGFDDFLKVGAKDDREIERFIIKRLLKGVDIDLNIASAGCSAFCAWNEKGERIFARNFDFDPAPALLLTTKPDTGFASMSIANLAFAGYGGDFLPHPKSFDSFLTLAAPYLPFDGMNEKGLAMALLAVPHAEPPQSGEGTMLNTTTMIRLVLDKAATVNEALVLIKAHPIYFSGAVQCHYLLADVHGASAIVEFLDGEVKVTPGDGKYQAVTNFIVYDGRNEGEGGTEFERYSTIVGRLKELGGIVSQEDAMAILSQTKIPGRTQWSVVYNLSTGEVSVCMGEKYDEKHTLYAKW